MQLLTIFLFLYLSLLPLSISISSPDISSLLFFKSTSDPSDSLSSWSDASDPCTSPWFGVSCHNNRVTRLVLERLNLQGPIQPLLQLEQLRVLSLSHNNLTSISLPLDFSPWKNMKLLYLSDNHLSGTFPVGLTRLGRLRRVDLSGNRFVGHIPSELNRLPHLRTLRLDRNSFTGTLFDFPQMLDEFNVSGNHLVGEIPKSLSDFPALAFAGNENLCGKPLQSTCSTKVVQSDPIPILISAHRRKFNTRTLMAIVLADVAALGLIIGVFIYCCWIRRRRGERDVEKEEKEKKRNGVSVREVKEEEMVFFEGCEGFETVEDLLRASAEMLGKGSVGSTYKAVMEGGGKAVVVKRVRERGRRKVGDWKEVDGLMREIGRLRHANVVGLRAYYWSKDEMLLVYDYMRNGSLHSLLHGNRGPGRTPLDWTTRLKLASGAAKGLVYLHTACEPKLAHGHLTSSNILVDHTGNACISDFALHHLIHPSMPLSSPHKAYMAPEFLENNNYNGRKVSEKGDVYSFGIVLLEILTGKMAGEEEMDIAKWVREAVHKELTLEVFDLELLRYKEMEEEMVALLQVALLCLGPIHKERPKMAVVYKMIEDIRARGRGGAHSPSANDLSSNSSPYLSDTPTLTSS
ncbi:probable leucine-rich repeat receptor-like protein kinase At1g68400 [Magnolia sinica]|uniref:probable leucine-rich repeat receptor-like protein kinase At1g68400 n=1 Tax=Magnolia sinica TaxID=86752 RepID=UPI002658373F|nr:probable leucine-rich repeat receptor-like protein kinase At1g68400 [Magnolia sinica]